MRRLIDLGYPPFVFGHPSRILFSYVYRSQVIFFIDGQIIMDVAMQYGKIAALVPEFVVEELPLAELQPRFLCLQ